MAHEVQAVVARRSREPTTLEAITVPDPGPGEALVRVQACGVCHTDLPTACKVATSSARWCARREGLVTTIERVVTSGVFALDGQEWEVDNNVWVVGDDDEVVVADAAHDHVPIVEAVGGRRVAAIVLTHGHNDHVNAAPALADAVEPRCTSTPTTPSSGATPCPTVPPTGPWRTVIGSPPGAASCA